MVLARLAKHDLWPYVGQDEWRRVYSELTGGEKLGSKDDVYTEIKNAKKRDVRADVKEKKGAKAKMVAEAQETAELFEGDKDQPMAVTVTVKKGRIRALEKSLAQAQEELKAAEGKIAAKERELAAAAVRERALTEALQKNVE